VNKEIKLLVLMTVEEKLKMQLQSNQTRKPRRQRPQNSYLMQPKEVLVLVEASWDY